MSLERQCGGGSAEAVYQALAGESGQAANANRMQMQQYWHCKKSIFYICFLYINLKGVNDMKVSCRIPFFWSFSFEHFPCWSLVFPFRSLEIAVQVCNGLEDSGQSFLLTFPPVLT